MPEGGRRAENGPPKQFKSRVETRETDDSNQSQTSRGNNPQQRAAPALKFNKFLEVLYEIEKVGLSPCPHIVREIGSSFVAERIMSRI